MSVFCISQYSHTAFTVCGTRPQVCLILLKTFLWNPFRRCSQICIWSKQSHFHKQECIVHPSGINILAPPRAVWRAISSKTITSTRPSPLFLREHISLLRVKSKAGIWDESTQFLLLFPNHSGHLLFFETNPFSFKVRRCVADRCFCRCPRCAVTLTF